METGNFFPKYLEKFEYNHLSNAVVRCIAVYFHVYKKCDWAFFMSWGMITYGVPPGHTGLSQGNINTSSVTHRLPVAFMNRDLASGKRTSWDRSQKPVTHNPGIPVNTGSIQPQPLSVSFIFQQLLQLRGNQRYFSQEQHLAVYLVLWMWEYDEAGRKIQEETNNPLRLYKPTGQTKKHKTQLLIQPHAFK